MPWKADLRWFLLFAALAQIGLIGSADWLSPQLYDAEYGTRLGLLRRRMAEEPGKPVALVVGSSHFGVGFLPERLPPLRSADGEVVLPVCFSHLAAGPVVNLMNLHRLIRAGVKPRWVVLELTPPFMEHEGDSMAITMASTADLPVVQRYVNPVKLYGVYLRGRLNPWYSWRLGFLRQWAPWWATDAGVEDRIALAPLGGDAGWLQDKQIDDATRRRRTEGVRALYYEPLQHYHIDSATDRALRESLDLCRREGVACALLITPESSEFRSWYTSEGLEVFDRYCDGLREDYGVPIIDARAWAPDEQFTDGRHLLRSGAEAFTDRLGREALGPLVEDRLRAQPATGR